MIFISGYSMRSLYIDSMLKVKWNLHESSKIKIVFFQFIVKRIIEILDGASSKDVIDRFSNNQTRIMLNTLNVRGLILMKLKK